MKIYTTDNISEIASCIFWDCLKADKAVFWSKKKQAIISLPSDGRLTEHYYTSRDYIFISTYNHKARQEWIKSDIIHRLKKLIKHHHIPSQLGKYANLMQVAYELE